MLSADNTNLAQLTHFYHCKYIFRVGLVIKYMSDIAA